MKSNPINPYSVRHPFKNPSSILGKQFAIKLLNYCLNACNEQQHTDVPRPFEFTKDSWNVLSRPMPPRSQQLRTTTADQKTQLDSTLTSRSRCTVFAERQLNATNAPCRKDRIWRTRDVDGSHEEVACQDGFYGGPWSLEASARLPAP